MLRTAYYATHVGEKIAVVAWVFLMAAALNALPTEGPIALYVMLVIGLLLGLHITVSVYRYNRLPLEDATASNEPDDDPTEPLPIIPADSFGIVSAVPSITSAGPRYDAISVLYLGQSFVWVRPHGVVRPGEPVDFIVDAAQSDIELLAFSQL
jgi:hypothetical protein